MKVKKFYIETYGCQMNVADSEVVAAILEDKGYQRTQEKSEADVILVNTCSVRENAEQRVRGRVQGFSEVKKKNPHVLVAIMGCMAERLGEALFEQEKNVNIVVGPDAYMDLPSLIEKAEKARKPSILNSLPQKPTRTSALPELTKQPYPDLFPSCGDVIISVPIVSFHTPGAASVAEVPEVLSMKF